MAMDEAQELQLCLEHDARAACKLGNAIESATTQAREVVRATARTRLSAVASHQALHAALDTRRTAIQDAERLLAVDVAQLTACLKSECITSADAPIVAKLRGIADSDTKAGQGLRRVLSELESGLESVSMPVVCNPVAGLAPATVVNVGRLLDKRGVADADAIVCLQRQLVRMSTSTSEEATAVTRQASSMAAGLTSLISSGKHMQAWQSAVHESHDPVVAELEAARAGLRAANAIVSERSTSLASVNDAAQAAARALAADARAVLCWQPPVAPPKGAEQALDTCTSSCASNAGDTCAIAIDAAAAVAAEYSTSTAQRGDACVLLHRKAEKTLRLIADTCHAVRTRFDDAIEVVKATRSGVKELVTTASLAFSGLLQAPGDDRLDTILPCDHVKSVADCLQSVEEHLRWMHTAEAELQQATESKTASLSAKEAELASLTGSEDVLVGEIRALTAQLERAEGDLSMARDDTDRLQTSDRAELEAGAFAILGAGRALADRLRGLEMPPGSATSHLGVSSTPYGEGTGHNPAPLNFGGPVRPPRIARAGGMAAIMAYALSRAAGIGSTSKRGASEIAPAALTGSLRLLARFDEDAEDLRLALSGLSSAVDAVASGGPAAHRTFELLTLLGMEMHHLARSSGCPDDAVVADEELCNAWAKAIAASDTMASVCDAHSSTLQLLKCLLDRQVPADG